MSGHQDRSVQKIFCRTGWVLRPRTGLGADNAWRAATLMRDYRRDHPGIGLGDYLIAANALTAGLELATLNIRHYPMFDGLARPFPT